LTSSNYNDSEKKTTGGRNGFGAKLANIFSTKFVIETADIKTNKYYKQVFRNNMLQKDQAIIESKPQKANFTCITFYPDLSKFKMKIMDADIISLMTKRAYDLAGVTEGRVVVKLNGKSIGVKNFNQYCDLYLKNKASLAEDLPKIVEKK
jgi:DNA topoisomerase-2